jgi:ComF family protein
VRSAIRLLGLLLRALSAVVADALAPPACAACDAPLARRAVFCPACAATVVRARAAPGAPNVDDVTSPAAFAIYGGAIAMALRRFKYEERPDLGRALGDFARRAARRLPEDEWTVVPVPLHARRLAERGYNQALLLARPVARELRGRLAPTALARTRNTPQQARLDRRGRLHNVEGAFRVASPSAVRGRAILLVDDVATSGATLTACATALREAGARRVAALVVARADAPGG